MPIRPPIGDRPAIRSGPIYDLGADPIGPARIAAFSSAHNLGRPGPIDLPVTIVRCREGSGAHATAELAGHGRLIAAFASGHDLVGTIAWPQEIEVEAGSSSPIVHCEWDATGGLAGAIVQMGGDHAVEPDELRGIATFSRAGGSKSKSKAKDTGKDKANPKSGGKLGGAGNCGTGSGGFKPGNVCGKGGRGKLAADLKAARAAAKDRHEAQSVRDAARGLKAHRRGKADAIDDATAGYIRGKLRAANAKAADPEPAKSAGKPAAKSPKGKASSVNPHASIPSAPSPPRKLPPPGRELTRFEGDADGGIAASRAATKYGKEKWAGWSEGLSRQEVNAFHIYKTSGFKEMNDGLRAGRTSDFASSVKAMDAAIGRAKTPESLVAYRGIKNASAFGLTPGQVIHDKAYLSTTLDAGVAKQFARAPGDASGDGGALIRFTIPKGTPGAFLDSVGRLDELGLREGEILLPRGSSLRIIKASGRHRGSPIYDAVLEVADGR